MPPPAPLAQAALGAPTDAAGEMVALTPERRARLIAYIEANNAMPAEAKARTIGQLQADQVPLQVVERLEQRIGG